MAERKSWIDEATNEPLIDDYAAKLTTFLDAMADGVIDDKEMSDQETRLVALLKEVEPTLNDEQHAKMTELMCELSAFNICLLYTSPSPRDRTRSRMPSSA